MKRKTIAQLEAEISRLKSMLEDRNNNNAAQYGFLQSQVETCHTLLDECELSPCRRNAHAAIRDNSQLVGRVAGLINRSMGIYGQLIEAHRNNPQPSDDRLTLNGV